MGLPVWRDPTETKQCKVRNTSDSVTATARSSIRRRPELPGRSSTRSRYAPPPYPSRLERGTTLRDPRRYASRLHNAANAAIPPVRSLLETVDRLTPSSSSAVAPPPVPALPIERPDPLPNSRSSDDYDAEFAEVDWFDEEDAEDELVRPAYRRAYRPHSRDGQSYRPRQPGAAGTIDRPDAWASGMAMAATTLRPDHPLRHSWRPSSPSIQGLGDRTRSPTPGEGWELMLSTIAADEVLPSAESSFASAAASRSFGSSHVSRAGGSSSPGTSVFSGATPGERTVEEWAAMETEYCELAESPSIRAVTEDMYVYACESSEGRMRLNQQHCELTRAGVMRITPAGLGLRLLERLSDEAVDEHLRPSSQIPTNLRRFLQCRRAIRSDPSQAHTATASDQTTNAQSLPSQSLRDTFNRAWTLYRTNFGAATSLPLSTTTTHPSASNPPTTDPSPPGPTYPTEVVSDIRAAHDIFTRLAARGDICDEIWETVGLLMTTSAGRLAESALSLLPIPIPRDADRRESAAPVIAAFHSTTTGATAFPPASARAAAIPRSETPPNRGAAMLARRNGDDGDYDSMLMALERSNRELLSRTRTLTDDVALVANAFTAAGARRENAGP